MVQPLIANGESGSSIRSKLNVLVGRQHLLSAIPLAEWEGIVTGQSTYDVANDVQSMLADTKGVINCPPGIMYLSRNNIPVYENKILQGHGAAWADFGLLTPKGGTAFVMKPGASVTPNKFMFELMWADVDGAYQPSGTISGRKPDYRHGGGLRDISLFPKSMPLCGGYGLRGVRYDATHNVAILRAAWRGFGALSWDYGDGPITCNGLVLDRMFVGWCSGGAEVSGGDSLPGPWTIQTSGSFLSTLGRSRLNLFVEDSTAAVGADIAGEGVFGSIHAQDCDGIGLALRTGSYNLQIVADGNGKDAGGVLSIENRVGVKADAGARGNIHIVSGQFPSGPDTQTYGLNNLSPYLSGTVTEGVRKQTGGPQMRTSANFDLSPAPVDAVSLQTDVRGVIKLPNTFGTAEIRIGTAVSRVNYQCLTSGSETVTLIQKTAAAPSITEHVGDLSNTGQISGIEVIPSGEVGFSFAVLSTVPSIVLLNRGVSTVTGRVKFL